MQNHSYTFSVCLEEIDRQIDQIDPIKYGKNRNYLDGAVTRLSPYISRGVVSVSHIAQRVLSRGYRVADIEIFLKELLWKEYFWRIGQAKGPDAFLSPLRFDQEDVRSMQIAREIIEGRTGITALDRGVRELYDTGYIHNHLRMYLSSLSSNIYGSDWRAGAKWMYAHLLDHDIASNMASWQWGCGVFASKKYYAPQENINRYTHTHDRNTILDVGYEAIEDLSVTPESYESYSVTTPLEGYPSIMTYVPHHTTTYIYTTQTLDPRWRCDEEADRILILDPSFFARYPISEKVLQWTLDLARAIIPEIRIYVGDISTLIDAYPERAFRTKEHYTMTSKHPRLQVDVSEWIIPEVSGYFPSFFAYYKHAQPYLFQLTYDPNTASRLSA